VVRFFNLSGQEVNHLTLPGDSQIIAVAGSRVFVSTQSGQLSALHRDGSSESLGVIDAGAPFVASPDGKRWVWATSTTQASQVASAIHLAGDGVAPRVIETASENYRSLRPYAWTKVGLFVEHGAMGIGGYIPYLPATGAVDEVNLATNGVKPIAGSDRCQFSDMAEDGTIACLPGQHTLRLAYPNGRNTDISLLTPRFNLSGDAYFSPDGQQLTVAGAVGVGFQAGEQYATDLVATSDASISRISLVGVRPASFMRSACWLPDGSLITYRPDNSADPQGTFIYHASRSSTMITKSGMPLGVLTG
jgi:hypothetical protein